MVFYLRVAGRHMVALVLLQAYVTSGLGQIRWEHSQAGHTHIDPDVGLRRARDGLLAEEEEVAGEELQLCLACPALQDDLRRGTRHSTCGLHLRFKDGHFFSFLF